MDLPALARRIRTHPGLTGKLSLSVVAETIGGDGDDAAIISDSGGELALAAEAISPAFIARDPRAAGIAGAVTVISDLIASGAEPLALLDTVVGGTEDEVATVLAGLAAGAELIGVPIVGGHTTIESGVGLSTFAVGRVLAPLKASAAKVGDEICLATCCDGEMFSDVEGQQFFSHLRGPRRAQLREDLGVVLAAAQAGEAWAARDVSMPGVAGSLLQMMESAGNLGCTLDLDALPIPDGVALETWLLAFPSYGFLLAGTGDALTERFAAAGLDCARIGCLDDSGRLRLASDGREELVWDLSAEPLTALGPEASGP